MWLDLCVCDGEARTYHASPDMFAVFLPQLEGRRSREKEDGCCQGVFQTMLLGGFGLWRWFGWGGRVESWVLLAARMGRVDRRTEN
jgi:hypothetical protein